MVHKLAVSQALAALPDDLVAELAKMAEISDEEVMRRLMKLLIEKYGVKVQLSAYQMVELAPFRRGGPRTEIVRILPFGREVILAAAGI